MLKGIYILDKIYQNLVYPEDIRQVISQNIDVIAPVLSQDEIMEYRDLLNKCNVIFSGWGCPRFDAETLDLMPNLRVVFYGAGSVKSFVTDEFWRRGIILSSAYGANAVPVSEYALSQILFGLKDGYRQMDFYHKNKRRPDNPHSYIKGCYGSVVGIISLGMIGKMVCEHLKNFELEVMAYDPYAGPEIFTDLGARRAESLEEIFETCDLVSVHTPWLPETEGMIRGNHIKSMKERAVLLNTSRGAVINEKEMIEVLKARKDLFAILDVTWPEPPAEDSELYSLENVRITPHIAGTMGKECQRMGQYMAEEMTRFINGEPLKYEINEQKSKILA